MSGRGRGRGGRGGRGSAPKTISQEFLLRSAKEAGFDVRNLRALGGRGGDIFPDIEFHSSGNQQKLGQQQGDGKSAAGSDGGVKVKQEGGGSQPADAASASTDSSEQQRSPKTNFLISKSREIHHRFQTSVFYVRSTKEVPDVVRYSDRLRPPPSIDAGAVLGHCLGGRKRTRCGVFVPEELVGGQRRIHGNLGGVGGAGQKGKDKKGLNLAELAAKIRKEGGLDNDAEEEENKQGGEEDGEFYEEDGEESDGADYVANYYESEGDESKGSDGEPTF